MPPTPRREERHFFFFFFFRIYEREVEENVRIGIVGLGVFVVW